MLGVFFWTMPKKGGSVAVVVVVSATTVLKKNDDKVTSVIYNGFYVGSFPSPLTEVSKGKNREKPTIKTRRKKQSTKSKYAMLFEDSTVNSLTMNQQEKKQASLYKVVTLTP